MKEILQSNDSIVYLGLRKCVEKCIKHYLMSHKSNDVPCGIYHRVMGEVEDVLLSSILEHVNNNHVQASRILGINRNTLRKKVKPADK